MSRIPAGVRDGSTEEGSASAELDLLLAGLPESTGGIVGHLVRRPRQAVRAARLLEGLRPFDVVPSPSEDGHALAAGLRRRSPLVRALMRGATGVLVVPDDPATFVSGNSRRTLRKKRNAAIRSGVRAERVMRDDRAPLLRLANEEERRHPDARYRNTSPDNRDLLLLDHWWLARDGDGEPLLLAVVAIDGEWAMLRYFRTLQQNEDATSARFMMMDVLVHEFAALGVRSLVTTMSPIRITPGLREFQHRVGFELARVRIPRRTVAERLRRTPRLPVVAHKS